MPYTKSRYSKDKTSEITFTTLDVLLEQRRAMSIDEIKACRINLMDITTQKMARVLTELNEKDLVRKDKNRVTGRMMYKATAVMKEEGYE